MALRIMTETMVTQATSQNGLMWQVLWFTFVGGKKESAIVQDKVFVCLV